MLARRIERLAKVMPAPPNGRPWLGQRDGRVTAHVSHHSAHDGEGEGKRGLGMGFHRVNYTIFAALCVGFRGRFPWPRKVSVVRREQIRVLNQNCTPARASALRTTFVADDLWSGDMRKPPRKLPRGCCKHDKIGQT